jgi:hypothetical protein
MLRRPAYYTSESQPLPHVAKIVMYTAERGRGRKQRWDVCSSTANLLFTSPLQALATSSSGFRCIKEWLPSGRLAESGKKKTMINTPSYNQCTASLKIRL